MPLANVRLRRYVSLIALLMATCGTVIAQSVPPKTPPTAGSSGSSSGLSLDFGDSMLGSMYVDALGLQAANLGFAPEFRIDPTQYILGPGDLLGIVIQGALTLSYRAMPVDIEGQVVIPNVGAVEVAGLSLLEANEAVRNAVLNGFRNVSVKVTIDKPSPVTVHVTGDIPLPGRFSVAYGTRLDAPLFASLVPTAPEEGGSESLMSLTRAMYPSASEIPGMTGNSLSGVATKTTGPEVVQHLLELDGWNLRNVRIDRADGSTVYADLYAYYYGGVLEGNPILYNGDRVQLKRQLESEPRVSVSGAVHASVEGAYRPDDTVGKLIRLGGGYNSLADTTSVIVYRQSGNGFEQIRLSPASDDLEGWRLQPNDRVVVPHRSVMTASASASIVGHASMPGIFPIRNGETTVSELLSMAGGLSSDALPKAAYVSRSRPEVRDMPVYDPTTLELMRGSDQLVQGLNWFELEQIVNKNRIYLDVSDPNQISAIRLFDGDSLVIPRDDKTVYVYGRVERPGFIEFESGQPVSYYVDQAGGFSLSAEPKKIYVIRAGSLTWLDGQTASVQSGDRIYVDRELLDDNYQRRTFITQRQNLTVTALSLLLTAMSTTFTIINFIRN